MPAEWEGKLNITLERDPEPFRTHINASAIVDIMGRKEFDTYFSFAFVRNPWDWHVSFYNYVVKDPSHHQHYLVRKLGSFEKYVEWKCGKAVRLQKDFVYSGDGELLVDFLGRHENLSADFQTICSRIGISTSLPKLNVSKTKPYQEFYSDETKELVRLAYDADIKLFGYDF